MKIPTEQLILTGWKDICHACGLRDIKAVKRWAKRFHMPIKRINGKPIIPTALLIEWFNNLPDRP